MSYDNNQNDGKANPSKRKTEQHLPKYFRTVPNSKFLSSTLDQLVQPGVLEKLNGYYGREASASFDKDDNYIGDFSDSRKNYQFEPAAVIKDNLDSVKFYKDYNDYMNQLISFNDKVKDHNIANKQEYYSWNPHINWDKFINFREYYWLPSGPQTIDVRGQTTEVVSTYTVSIADNLDNFGYVFSPDGLTQNPTIKLFRGVTYKFDINTPGLPFTIRTKRSLNEADMLSATNNLIDNQGTEEGVITFTPTDTTPNILYYVADNDIEAAGLIKVANIEESSVDSDNIKLIKGSWNRRLLSDQQLRGFHNEELLSIIPIKDTYQPSGQSVALQSMAMKIPVMISDTIGFWDKEMFKNNENIFFVNDNNLDSWTNRIETILTNTKLKDTVSTNGNKTTLEHYDSDYFYKSLIKIIFRS